MDDKKVYVLCVSEEDPHTEESILTQCVQCGRQVWVSLHNTDKQCVCIHCVVKAVEEGTDDIQFKVALPDIIEAFRHLVKTGKIKL